MIPFEEQAVLEALGLAFITLFIISSPFLCDRVAQ